MGGNPSFCDNPDCTCHQPGYFRLTGHGLVRVVLPPADPNLSYKSTVKDLRDETDVQSEEWQAEVKVQLAEIRKGRNGHTS